MVVDIIYDHLLAKHWSRYVSLPFRSFIDRFHIQAMAASKDYPQEIVSFLSRLTTSGHLKQYRNLQGLEVALSRIDQRLSASVLSRESSSDYLPRLKQELRLIEDDFAGFMPDLITHFKSTYGDLRNDHWLI